MSMRKEQLGGAGVPGCGDLACVFNEIPVSLRPPWKSVQKEAAGYRRGDLEGGPTCIKSRFLHPVRRVLAVFHFNFTEDVRTTLIVKKQTL